MDEISRFRQEALPKMANTILEMDRMTEEQEKVIKDLEEGNKVSEALKINP
jgi:uncharacterized protein YaaN involved in tellurite resistance